MNVGLSSAEVTALINDSIQQLDSKIDRMIALGCNSEAGCRAGKKHFQEHQDKWASDINNLKENRKAQEKENKDVSKKLSEVVIMFHDTIRDLSGVLKNVQELKNDLTEVKEKTIPECEERSERRIKIIDARLWGLLVIFLGALLGILWNGVAVKNTVGKINSVDVKNQERTETWLKLMAGYVSGKPPEEVQKEYLKKIQEEKQND